VRPADRVVARYECLLCFAAFGSLFIGDCDCNLYVLLVQALSLTKTTEKIISEEDGGNLRRCVAKLEEENSQLKVSTVDSSAEAVTVLRRALDEGIEGEDKLRRLRLVPWMMLQQRRKALLTSVQSLPNTWWAYTRRTSAKFRISVVSAR
jgi:hypothetical protein